MHYCQDCRWSGQDPKPLEGDERLAVLKSLKPGAIVPSGICRICDGHVIPAEIGPFPVPESLAEQAPWEGWRWNATLSMTTHSLILGLFDRIAPRFAELVFDASAQRPRFDLSVSTDSESFLTQEPQMSASIGDGHVACYPSGDPASNAVIFTNEGIAPGEILTMDEFENLAGWNDRLQATIA